MTRTELALKEAREFATYRVIALKDPCVSQWLCIGFAVASVVAFVVRLCV